VAGCLDQCPANSYPTDINGGKVCRNCLRQLSQTLQGNTCICPAGQTYFEGNCYTTSQLPPNCTNKQLLINGQCVDKNILAALNCPANSAPTANRTSCRCNSGFESVNNECLPLCPPNSRRTSYGICACTYGFIMNSSQLCESICPKNSQWRTDLNECRCNYDYQMVQGVCSSCPAGQVYDPNTGSCLVVYNAVNNANDQVGVVSVTCGLYQTYQNGKCVCNANSIDSNGNCYPCPSFTFKNGNTCMNCPAYCQTCQSTSTCQSCQTGFDLINGVCQEKCGDGRRFVVECDDGNLRNGDGCSSNCRVETGYICTGGSAISTDTCQRTNGGGSTLTISMAQGYPRYISSGILASFIVNPPIIRSQAELDSLFNIAFPNALSTPNTIYISQSANDPASISCLMLYHSDLPNLTFSVTFTISEFGRGSAHVTWLFDTISNGITAAIQRPTSNDILN
jgi:cysteine-rich repeat protein